MTTIKKSIKLAIVGTSVAAVAALSSCCGSSPDPEPTPPTIVEPAK